MTAPEGTKPEGVKREDQLKHLATIASPCLTILEPVRDPVSPTTKADTRLIDAAHKADALLIKKGLSAGDRERFLAPVREFALNTDWTGRSGSVVIFRAPDFMQATFWPDILEAEVRLADQFLILPLLSALTATRNYWVLALSINRIHLFRGKGDEFSEFELPATLPRSLAAFIGLEKADPAQGELHVGPNQHESDAGHLHDYFKAIERAIHPILGRTAGDPLILAAVARELALYRLVNTYSPLVEEGIHGSPDALGVEKLRRSALDVLATHSLHAMDAIRGDLDTAAGRKLQLTDPAEIAEAASLGKVARLFIDRRATGEIINAAALAVIHNSGTVVCCEGLAAPGGIAAILRYRTEDEAAAAPEFSATAR